MLQANNGLEQIGLIVQSNAALELLHRLTVHTSLYEIRERLGGRIATYPDHWCRTDWHRIAPIRIQLTVSKAGPQGFREDTKTARRKEGERYNNYKQEVKRWGKPLPGSAQPTYTEMT